MLEETKQAAQSQPHQGEEGAEQRDGAKVGDVGVHVVVLFLSEQRVVALDAAALHVLVPAGLDVGLHQGSLALARRVELDLLHLVLGREGTKKKKKGRDERRFQIASGDKMMRSCAWWVYTNFLNDIQKSLHTEQPTGKWSHLRKLGQPLSRSTMVHGCRVAAHRLWLGSSTWPFSHLGM